MPPMPAPSALKQQGREADAADRDAGASRRALVATDRLHVPPDPRLADDDRGEADKREGDEEEQRQRSERR